MDDALSLAAENAQHEAREAMRLRGCAANAPTYYARSLYLAVASVHESRVCNAANFIIRNV